MRIASRRSPVFRTLSTSPDTHPIRAALALSALCLLAAPTAPGLAAFAQPGASQGAVSGTPIAASDDSSAPARDPFLAPPPNAAADSNAAAMPSMEAVKLSTQGAFTSNQVRVGDSLDYVVQVEWEDTQVPVFVLAPDSLDFPGFRILGQATEHKKIASGSSVKNHTEFIYRLRAQTQGTGKASSLKIRYLTGLSKQEEAVYIPTALADIGPAPVRILDMLWFRILMVLAILGGAGALGYAAFKAAKRRAAQAPKRDDLKPDVNALRNRLRSAQNTPDASKAILLEMERLAIRFMQDEAGANGAAKKSANGSTNAATAVASQARFEPQLQAYLKAKPAGTAADGTSQDWDKLKELFRHARFAGGHLEPHELQDAFRTFRKCLKMTGEDEHE
jgi:hypothetical protein